MTLFSKEVYVSPEIDVILFEEKDIVTSSGKDVIELPPVPIWN